MAVSQPTVSRCVTKVTSSICDRLHQWIKFPQTDNEMAAVQERFRANAGFPGIVGLIDCTHISIVTPAIHAEGYRNRKGYFSLNTQMTCDDRMVITNVVTYPGSVHDQFIWNFCQLKNIMRNTDGGYFLLGDSGYALEPWLITPLPQAEEGTPAYRFTMAHCHTRNKIERVFGILKARWRCPLKDRTLHYTPEKASKIIVCCAILHNIMMHHRIPLPENEVYEDLQDNGQRGDMFGGDQLTIARRRQMNIIQRYFTI
ncbi:putative nuclease HARBI1 [Ischnura elegans]|uniref:putative nuclease HARBI1 n=1 Tax=Ischnura elegans TaxID=197161 RepID=UPI001ED891A3|nr:putative nuclease HARBI1 [Ischnura elegans]